ncbi:MAG: hypothetical protein AAFU79_36935, partial [Myxococcota bacterium]
LEGDMVRPAGHAGRLVEVEHVLGLAARLVKLPKGDERRFIAFWELHETGREAEHEFDLNKAAGMPRGTNHISFEAASKEELDRWRVRWNEAGYDVLEIDHNWCHSVYTHDPNGNFVEFCVTTQSFSGADRERALAALEEAEFRPSPAPAFRKMWPGRREV